MVVIGGAALLALGIIDRPTRDVDLLALRMGEELVKADPLRLSWLQPQSASAGISAFQGSG